MKKLAINPSNKKYYSNEYIKGWEDGVKAQYEATIDAVEVVRCKECIHYESDGGAMMICNVTDMVCDNDDYCSYGERREDGEA